MSPLMCMVFVANLVLMEEVFVQGSSISDEESFERTFKSANKFKCGIPQPRNFAVSEIFDNNMSSICYIVLPPSAVLHVCDSACGSCNQHYHCQPKDSEEVKLAFKIISRTNNDKDGSCHFTTSENRIQTVMKVNHTRCSCQMLSNTPK